MALAGMAHARRLAEMAVQETTIGVLEDKVLKNLVACEFVWDSIKDKKTVGIIKEDPEHSLAEAAEPVGLILSMTPITNPTSTVIFKCIVAAKTANTLIVSPHSKAHRCSNEAARIMYEAGLAAGAPKNFITWIEEPTRDDTLYLMKHPLVQLIDATGGRSMVKVAYSSGKPALGVGSGNTATYLHRTANIDMAVVDIVTSKTFDNGVICASEGTVLIDEEIYETTLDRFRGLGCHVATPAEREKLESILIDPGTCSMRQLAVGRSATQIAQYVGIDVPANTNLILVELPGVGREFPLSAEKLCPVLGIHKVRSEDEALEKARAINAFGGTGHTASIFTEDPELVRKYATAINAGRIVVNSPSSIGAMGGVYNDLVPTFSFGCGTGGGNSEMDNVSIYHYLNLKKIARRTPTHQWFRVPSHIFFGRDALENLRQLEAETVVIACTRGAVKRGVVEKIQKHLKARVFNFTGLTEDPSVEILQAGAAFLRDRKPDTLIAVGGGSVLDAAKVMRLLALSDVTIDQLDVPFLDFRKRAVDYPKIDIRKMKLVAIPTTSGTGSEVSPFAVVNTGTKKLSLVDTSLVPDAAILDPELTADLPAGVTAATGMDALTHALEAGMSIFASEYTDALAFQAARIIFHWLPRAVDGDFEARGHMQNAANIAGLAFSNASVGLTHALSHATGAVFQVPHGALNGIFLPAVLRFNAGVPTKVTPNPNVKAYVAPKKIRMYCELVGLKDVGGLAAKIEDLKAKCGLPRRLRDAGISEADFRANLDRLVDLAFADPSLITNPRRPLLSEIRQLFEEAF
jgi:acetaldehyde dehydrogenase/alcohol dehydrogenase